MSGDVSCNNTTNQSHRFTCKRSSVLWRCRFGSLLTGSANGFHVFYLFLSLAPCIEEVVTQTQLLYVHTDGTHQFYFDIEIKHLRFSVKTKNTRKISTKQDTITVSAGDWQSTVGDRVVMLSWGLWTLEWLRLNKLWYKGNKMSI